MVGENAPCLLKCPEGASGGLLGAWQSQSVGSSRDNLSHCHLLHVQNKACIRTGFAQAKLHAIGIVVQEMPHSIGFYRLLGLGIPEGEELAPHVEYVSYE